ncbi:hypothetical protein TH66_18785 [Carbonactinospora thermoautotrophica]|uniref:Phosphoenolpyruvate synthase n=2 Tax=Carbonactinospora thermoautotrophica TaxID=1469144 RepID=A0A132MIF1_9ACTN|nr:hypothetical protein TH66_18785 [Carbonactinospora thermoautotrophica]
MIPWVTAPTADREVCGGKMASLARLAAAGLPTPRGFVVTTAAFREVLDPTGLTERVSAILRTMPPGPARLHAVDAVAREVILTAPWPLALEAALREAHAELTGRTPERPLAVRSSATWEDTPTASAAGQLRSVIGVTGPARLRLAVPRVWAAAFSPTAVAYRERAGLPAVPRPVAVGVQELVAARLSGVAYSAHPVTGDTATLVIEAITGLCGPLVDGRVVPEHLELGRDGSLRARRPARQHLAAHYDPVRQAVVERAASEPVRLGPEHLDVIRRGLLRAEAVFGRPVDIEWSWHPATGLTILQARPVTVPGTSRVSAGGPVC